MNNELVERVDSVLRDLYVSNPDTPPEVYAQAVLAELAGELRDADDAPTHRHFKGSYYRVIAHGKLERDQSEVVIYKAMSDGTVWVRSVDVFYDGRFTPLTKAIDEARHG